MSRQRVEGEIERERERERERARERERERERERQRAAIRVVYKTGTAPSLHAPRAGTRLTVYRAHQVQIKKACQKLV